MVWVVAAAAAAVGGAGLPRVWRWPAFAPWVIIAAASAMSWMATLPDRQEPIGVQVGRHIATRLETNDLVVVVGLWQLEVEHGIAVEEVTARDRLPSREEVRTLPRRQAEHPGWLDLDGVGSPTVLEEARVLRSDVEGRGGRVWLVYSPALPVEESVIPAFSGWRRSEVFRSSTLFIDLVVPYSSRSQLPGPE
jgi:hypothetical protein